MEIKRQRDDADHELRFALQAHQSGNLDKAEQMYRSILFGNPHHCDALHLLGVISHQRGENDQALSLIQQAIQIDPRTSFYYCSLGDVYSALKKFGAAVVNYQKAIEVNPALVEAHYNLANTFQLQGKLDNAVACYHKALVLKPDLVEAHHNLAIAYKNQGKLEESITCYQHVITLKPDHFDAYFNLGKLYQVRNAFEQAITFYEKAKQLKPEIAEIHLNLGTAFKKQGHLEQAIDSYRNALELKPDLIHAWKHLGRALRDLGQLNEAIASYQKALELNPEDGETHYHMGNAFRAHNRLDRAISCFKKALQLAPNQALVHNNLGIVLCEQNELEQAIWHLQKATRIDPENFNYWNNLGAALHKFGRLEQAVTSYETCLQLKPDDAEAYNNLAVAYKDRGKIQDAIAAHFKALTLKPTYSVTRSNILLAMNYHTEYPAERIFRESKKWWQQHGAGVAGAISHINEPDAARRLKVGYVSADFRQHSVSFFFLPLLAAHDRDQVEVYCYSGVKSPDQMTDRIRQLADHWCSMVGLSDEAVAERIYADGMDILVDLAGHTAGHRLLVFARKPAPVQVSWLGYPNTTGLATMDYRFTDAQADPEGEADRYHSETLVRLPQGFLCYRPPEVAPQVGRLPAATLGRMTFGSFNTLPKINAEVIGLWSQILHQVPASQLLLKCKQLADEPTRQDYVAQFVRHGVSADRIVMLPQTPGLREHLEIYNRVDIALDPFPYNGTTTTCEALWMGVPVVVLRGYRHAGRVGVSLLTGVGLEELIADSEADYVARAVDLAQDPQRLVKLRSRLRGQMQSSPLCDANTFARQIEKSFRKMWHKWCQGNFVDAQLEPLTVRSPIRKEPSRVLISHHWVVSQIPAERFGDDVYCVSHDRHPDFGHPRVLRVPFGHAYDVADVIKKLPNGWQPDLFVAKVDAFFNQVPVNVAQLKCPKVLILGDTQHGENPLTRMIQYATTEKYDIYVTDHKRHHLWYYWLAGIHELYWLPGLFLNPPDAFLPQRQGPFGEKILSPPSKMRINPQFYHDKVVFLGQCGRFHPRRRRIINYLKQHFSNFWAQQIPHPESFVAYNRAPISLNISLNGDLNLRVFEVIAANGFLLTDVLADESGINLILEEAKDYVGYTGLEDLKTYIRELVRNSDLIAQYRRHAFDRYLQDLCPSVMGERLKQLLGGRIIDNRFTSQSLNRIQYHDGIRFSADRLLIYEIVQEQHKQRESVHILFDARFTTSSVLDFLDLPRTRITVYGADGKYKSRLSDYLNASRQQSRVQFAELNYIKDCYDFLLTVQIDRKASDLLKSNGLLISSDLNGVRHFSGNNNHFKEVGLAKEGDLKIVVLTKD